MKKMPEINLEKYKADFLGYKYSISFVGNPSHDNCLDVLCELAKIYGNKLSIFCNEKDFSKSVEKIKEKELLGENDLEVYLKCHKNFAEDEEAISKIYNASKINLSINPKENASINKQIFEVLLSGGFLITNEQDKLKKHFEASKHLETYKNKNDLIDKIDFYLKNLNIAQKITQLGRFEIIKNYTITKRVKNLH